MTRIQEPAIEWHDLGDGRGAHLRSLGFDDVYYNRKSGLEETRLVFLSGNNLPENWLGKRHFTIAETGFGTGLNFLATWQSFEETATNGERLDFVSVEKYPLAKNDLTQALASWRDLVGARRVDRLLEIYPPRFPGFHRRWVTDRITLTLIFDDVLRAYQQLEANIDAWFLDGFSPRKNAEMWRPELYAEIARLSHKGTTLGSFTAVGDVRRQLKEIGFAVKREKGFAYKYHRTTAVFQSGKEKPLLEPPAHVAIIGAGLAGAGAAYALQRRGINVTVMEKEGSLGCGASGNRLGLINPKIEAQDNPRNDAGLSAFSFANHILRDIPGIDYIQNGALHVPPNDTKADKFDKLLDSAGWLTPHLQAQDKGIFYNDAASVNTSKLVPALLKNIVVKFNHPTDTLADGVTVLANGLSLREFLPTLPLQPVRGQVTYASTEHLVLTHPVMYGHYAAPLGNGVFSFGASFEQNNDQATIKDSDDAANIAAAQKIFPQLTDVTITARWAGVRTASRDRFPMVGSVPGRENLYVSGALGSHGIQFGLLHGEILASLLTDTPLPISRDALSSLSVSRFFQDQNHG